MDIYLMRQLFVAFVQTFGDQILAIPYTIFVMKNILTR